MAQKSSLVDRYYLVYKIYIDIYAITFGDMKYFVAQIFKCFETQ